MSLEVVWLVWWILCLLFCCILHVLGRGVFASKQIELGQFICEYFGELISAEEGEVRERSKASCFRYFFDYKGSAYWWAFHICLSSEVSLWLQAVLTYFRINLCVILLQFFGQVFLQSIQYNLSELTCISGYEPVFKLVQLWTRFRPELGFIRSWNIFTNMYSVCSIRSLLGTLNMYVCLFTTQAKKNMIVKW